MFEQKKYPHISTMIPHLWELFSDAEKELWQIYSTYEEFKPKEAFYTPGGTPEYCYVLIEGKVKILMYGPDGRGYVVHLVQQGRLFGHRFFFSGSTYNATAEAMERCVVYKLPITVLQDISASNSEFVTWLLEDTCADMMENDRRFVALMSKHSRARLADALLLLKETFGTRPGKILDIEPTRRDLGELSNMTTSNAIRTLSAFEEEGLVKLSGRQIKLLDIKELEDIARMG